MVNVPLISRIPLDVSSGQMGVAGASSRSSPPERGLGCTGLYLWVTAKGVISGCSLGAVPSAAFGAEAPEAQAETTESVSDEDVIDAEYSEGKSDS